jgi:predicted nucleic acid-binding protein
MTVVCDTSPLLLLARADRLDLLPVLYSTVVVPEEVLREIRVQRDAPAREIQAYTEHPRVQRTDARNEVLKEVEETMGSGERAAIAIALDREAELVPKAFGTMNEDGEKRDGMGLMLREPSAY